MRKKYQNWRPVVCMSGFSGDQNLQSYGSAIGQLGGKHEIKLGLDQDVLIIKNIFSEKYKINNLRKNGAIPVSLDWLLVSQKNKRFEDPEKYRIKHYFYGLSLGVYGFTAEEKDCIQELVEQQYGTVVTIQKLESYLLGSSESEHQRLNFVDLLLVSDNDIKRVRDLCQMLEMPVVGTNWLQRCMRTQEFIDPRYYAINHELQYCRKSAELMFYAEKQASCSLQRPEQEDQNPIFKDVVCYVHGFEEETSNSIRRIISVFKGFFVFDFGSIVTHVVLDKLDDKDFHKFTKYGQKVKIVRKSWVVDCFLKGELLSDQDYKPLRMRPEMGNVVPTLLRSTKSLMLGGPSGDNSIGFNSFSFSNVDNHNPWSGLNLGIEMRKSSSITLDSKDIISRPKKVTPLLSNIFRNIKFHIIPSQKQQPVLRDISSRIRSYGGQVVSAISSSMIRVFIVMNDGNNKEHLGPYVRYNKIVKPVSYRWVNYCISKNQFISYDDPNYYVFEPFYFNTPFLEYMELRFAVIGFDDVKRQRIRELLDVVAQASAIKNLLQVTHAICEKSTYKQFKTYEELKKNNPNVKFVLLDWVVDSVKQKKIVPIQQYLLD